MRTIDINCSLKESFGFALTFSVSSMKQLNGDDMEKRYRGMT